MSSILIVTDTSELTGPVQAFVADALGASHDVSAISAKECPIWLPRLAADADFFMLELLWGFPGGQQAQGLTLARRQLQNGKKFLIFSYFSLANRLGCDCYWDVSSTDRLTERAARLLNRSADYRNELAVLESRFASLLALPKQHQ